MFKHLEELQLSYCTHLTRAITFAIIALCASVVFIVHALLPCVFVNTGSGLISYLNSTLNKDKNNEPSHHSRSIA
jgi:hypothetical protein